MLAFTIIFILGIILFLILLLNILSLPANWIVLCIFISLYFLPGLSISFSTIAILFGIALCAEILEFFIQHTIAKKSGASTAGNWGGIIGSIVGAIIGVPFFLGIGALLGALAGAWLGCYAIERSRGIADREASRSAFGALRGKFFGFTIKMALGIYLVIYGLQNIHIFPEQKEDSSTSIISFYQESL